MAEPLELTKIAELFAGESDPKRYWNQLRALHNKGLLVGQDRLGPRGGWRFSPEEMYRASILIGALDIGLDHKVCRAILSALDSDLNTSQPLPPSATPLLNRNAFAALWDGVLAGEPWKIRLAFERKSASETVIQAQVLTPDTPDDSEGAQEIAWLKDRTFFAHAVIQAEPLFRPIRKYLQQTDSNEIPAHLGRSASANSETP